MFPEIVLTDKDGYKSVDYGKLTPVLIEAIKELSAENAALRADSEALKKSNNVAMSEINTLSDRLNKIEAMLLEGSAGKKTVGR